MEDRQEHLQRIHNLLVSVLVRLYLL